MTPIATALTHAVAGLRYPIVVGPMANAAGGALAGAVSRAGALGFIGAGYFTEAKLEAEVAEARAVLGEARDARLGVGIGFLVWKLQEAPQAARGLLDSALAHRPCALWLSFGDADATAAWAAYVRERDAAVRGTLDPIRLFYTACTLHEAQCIAETGDADVLVLQGHEAGGHGSEASPSRDNFLASVLRARSTWSVPKQPVLLTAGGMCTGNAVAAQLAFGADGAVLGTRFLPTHESMYTDAQKQCVLRATEKDTLRSLAFDEARNTLGWPTGVDGRGLRNATVADYEAALRTHSAPGAVPGAAARQQRYKEAVIQGDTDRIITWAGTGVGQVHALSSAADAVDAVAQALVASLRRVAHIVT